MTRTLTLLLTLLTFCGPAPARSADDAAWAVKANPYRVRLRLDQKLDAPAVLAVEPEAVIERVARVAVDQVDPHTLAFERSVLVNPATGRVVGRFKLLRVGEPFDVDGSFAKLERGGSPWHGFASEKMTLAPTTLGGRKHLALLIREEKITNARLQQRIELEAGRSYLLEYWIMMEPVDNEMNVMIRDPEHTLFSHVPHSYYNKMPPFGEWAQRSVLFRARTHDAEGRPLPRVLSRSLEITHAFVGRGGVAGLRLQEVAWRLVVEPDAPIEELDLYVLARAGHRLAASPADHLEASPPRRLALAEVAGVDVQPLNPQGVAVRQAGVSAWTIDPTLPLKAGLLHRYRPPDGVSPKTAQVTVCRGGSASLVVAVDAGVARLDDLAATSDLPAEVSFHRLATIPVYDGPTVDGEVKGKLIETRYDAMVPLDYALDPDSEDGLHVVVATITPRADTPAGAHHGAVTLRFAGKTVMVPVELRIADLRIRPMRHTGSIIGASSFFLKPRAGAADMAADGTSIAEYHGLDHADPALRDKARPILGKYFHTLLDSHLMPESPALGVSDGTVHVRVIERGPGRAPELTDWALADGYEAAVREFVVERDAPWFMIGRTNGHLMHMLHVQGKVYSFEAHPDDPRWVQLPREEFYKLVGDYWDGMAKLMDEMGIVDRLVFVIDESQESTYDTIYQYVTAFKARPYAGRMKVGHTIQKPSTWTRRLENGELMMDAVLDMPMPANDEHYNFFEQEWNNRLRRDDLIPWVYYVESDHFNLENAGLSTALLPLKLEQLGVEGWYIWEVFNWSLPYAHLDGQYGSFKYKTGPVGNPWQNPFYHHGPGVLSYFYPPDPRGPAAEPTDLIIPSFRLTLLRDGLQERALLEVLRAGRDDAGRTFDVDAERLRDAEARLDKLWPDNPVQWYLDYADYHAARRTLFDLAMESAPRADH